MILVNPFSSICEVVVSCLVFLWPLLCLLDPSCVADFSFMLQDCLYHHPVHKISFMAQDMTDTRAFGYIFGSPDAGHKFFGIKSEKAASQVVIAMRDLFQVSKRSQGLPFIILFRVLRLFFSIEGVRIGIVGQIFRCTSTLSSSTVL